MSTLSAADIDALERDAHLRVLEAIGAVKTFDSLQSPALVTMRGALVAGAARGIAAYVEYLAAYRMPPIIIRGLPGNGPITALVKRDDASLPDYSALFSLLAALCLEHMHVETFAAQVAAMASDLRDTQRHTPGTHTPQAGTLRQVVITSVLRACLHLASHADDSSIADMDTALTLQAALLDEKLALRDARHAWRTLLGSEQSCWERFKRLCHLAHVARMEARSRPVPHFQPRAAHHGSHTRGDHGKRYRKRR